MRCTIIAAGVAVTMAGILGPSGTASAQDVPAPLVVGDVAPDFRIPGATRHGVLADPVTLSEYEGKTVVLTFFFRARTKG